MTLCQTITLDFEQEMKSTRKMLERIVLDESTKDFTPHAKSMSLQRLATHVAELPGWIRMALETEVFDLPADFKPTLASSGSELLEMFDKAVAGSVDAISAAKDEDMMKTWTFSFAGQHVFTSVRTEVIRSFINHLVHHRGQLTVYMRMNDIDVPAIYGPSADDRSFGQLQK